MSKINTTEQRKLYAEGTQGDLCVVGKHNDLHLVDAMHVHYPALLDAWDEVKIMEHEIDKAMTQLAAAEKIAIEWFQEKHLEIKKRKEIEEQLAKARELVRRLKSSDPGDAWIEAVLFAKGCSL